MHIDELLQMMTGTIQTGSQFGMQTLNQALLSLYRTGSISKEEALGTSPEEEELKNMFNEALHLSYTHFEGIARDY